MLALNAAGRLRAALVAVVGGRGRGFTDPPPCGLLAPKVKRVLRITGQAVALGLANTCRAASWLAAPSPAQCRWLLDALGWSAAPAAPLPTALPPLALALAAATAVALVAVWLGASVRPRRHITLATSGAVCVDGGAATVAAVLLAACISPGPSLRGAGLHLLPTLPSLVLWVHLQDLPLFRRESVGRPAGTSTQVQESELVGSPGPELGRRMWTESRGLSSPLDPF
jgi:hypothetical protein